MWAFNMNTNQVHISWAETMPIKIKNPTLKSRTLESQNLTCQVYEAPNPRNKIQWLEGNPTNSYPIIGSETLDITWFIEVTKCCELRLVFLSEMGLSKDHISETTQHNTTQHNTTQHNTTQHTHNTKHTHTQHTHTHNTTHTHTHIYPQTIQSNPIPSHTTNNILPPPSQILAFFLLSSFLLLFF